MQNKEIQEKSKQTCKKIYGAEFVLQLKEVKEKGKQTKKEKYGNENYNNCIKMKQTNKEKYGDENYNNRKKYKQTCQDKWGVDNVFQSKDIKEKSKQTCLKHYGVENPSQNKEIHVKQQKSKFELKQFRNTNIWYQGTYEEDFLNKYYDLYPEIINPGPIEYFFDGKKCYYFPDFYIKSLNLMIEIKSTWIIEQQGIERIDVKEKTTIIKGFKYIMIVDKDYSEFNHSFNVGIL